MDKVLEGQRLFLTRLAIGLAQGLALYFLYHVQDVGIWPATNGLFFGPLLLVWLVIPVLLALSLGQIDWRHAVYWGIAAAILIAGLGWYDIWSAWPQDWSYGSHPGLQPHIVPSPQIFVFGGGGFLIAHALVIGGHIDHRFKANYETHFDVAWKLAVQLALSGAFVLAFWLLLWLGAGLFELIKLDFFKKLLEHEWFSIPVITLAVAGALHLTDIRPALVRGARTLLLTLLSWLLPLVTLISAGFLASLPFTGLAPLWSFGHASALLLIDAAAIIILINAAHQDGNAERAPPKILRFAGTVAAVLPVPLVAIAGYALFLRVQQYGWSADRVIVAAVITVAGGYAVGYARAAISRGEWLARIEDWNFAMAILVLAVLIALFTPIAKPERIAVADQVARLQKGKISPARFDFSYLRQRGGHYGLVALDELSRSQDALVRTAALASLKQANPYASPSVSPELWAARIRVHPDGSKLPDSFLRMDWGSGPQEFKPSCTGFAAVQCDAISSDLDGDGRPEILLMSETDFEAQIFRETGNGTWRMDATIVVPYRCKSLLDAIRRGNYKVSPEIRPWGKIEIAGTTLHVQDRVLPPKCPK